MNAVAQQTARVGFYRNMSETESHLVTGWQDQAFCGAQPTMRDIGWMFGADNTVFSGITEVCSECQESHRSLMDALARRAQNS